MNTESNFKVGTEVALFRASNWGTRRFSKCRVAKVYKNGRFILDGGVEGLPPTQYRVNSWNPDSAMETGKGFHKTHVEVWTEKHDEELVEQKKQRHRNEKVQKFEEWLSKQRTYANGTTLTDEQIALLEQVMHYNDKDETGT